MRVDSLRLRIMSVLGLPLVASAAHACAAQPGQDPPADQPTTVVPVGDVASANPVAVSAASASEPAPVNERPWVGCRRDQTLEWFCGGRNGTHDQQLSSCPKRPDEIRRQVSLLLPGTDANTLPFDAGMSRLYARHTGDAVKACCYSQCQDLTVRDATAKVGSSYGSRRVCISPTTGGTSKPARMRVDCPAGLVLPGRANRVAPFNPLDSTAEGARLRQQTGMSGLSPCCYDNGYSRPPHVRLGRALRDSDGRMLEAAPVAASAWHGTAGVLSLADLSEAARQTLGRRWLADAALEHASVGAFCKLSLQLLALGAPAGLLTDCHEAAADEVAHAELSYALADRYLGTSHGPGPLPLPQHLDSAVETLILETLLDGCLGETTAALLAAVSAERCAHQPLAAAFGRIALDEQRHAELAWRVLAWGVAHHPRALRALERGLALLRERALEPKSRMPAADSSELSAHGWLSDSERLELERMTLRQVVLPCAEALAARHRRPQSSQHAPSPCT